MTSFKKIYFAFTAILFLSFLTGIAQSSIDTTIRIGSHSEYKKKKKRIGEENTIKIAPIGFISGSFPILYERVINDFFSIQTGLGFTGRNYIREVTMVASDFDKYNYPWGVDDGSYSDQANGIYNFDNRKSAPGLMLNLQPRLYFDSDAPDGSYFGADLTFYRYNFKIPGIVYGAQGYTHSGKMFKEHENVIDLMGYWGYQSVFDRLSVDYSVGLGFRKVKGEKYSYGASNISTPNVEGMAAYTQKTFNFNAGIRIGYHF